MARSKRSTAQVHDLRRWAVEQAIRWPTYRNGSSALFTSGGEEHDHDVVARAKKLENYVLGKATRK